MRVTISQDDSTVTVDGVTHTVDCSDLPMYVRVIQWDDARGRGHIALDPDERGVRMGHLPIRSLDPFQYLVDRWHIAGTLRAREESQARVDEVIKQIATREQEQAQKIAQQAAYAQEQAELQHMVERAERERETRVKADTELKELRERLANVERQLAREGQ